jgi:circadian clock protein KaiC
VTPNAPHEPHTLPRLPTGVPGLDEIIGGGLLKSGVYIVQGAPGAGKTILANQICFQHAHRGGHVVYVTMLAESHARLFQHLETMSFFDLAVVPESVYFVSGFDALRNGGLQAVVSLLRGEMRAHRAGILVLDGLVMAAMAAASDQALKIFISEIQAHSTLTGCTTLLLASDDADHPVSAEQTMVDGILKLRETAFGQRRVRNIEIVKFRGSATLRGTHAFRITDDGIVIHPRLESASRESPGDAIQPRRLHTGVPGLDEMVGGEGLQMGTVTAVSGYAGAGKTLLGLHFAAQASAEEPALIFSFFESPEFLCQIGATFGHDLAGLRAKGLLHFVWQPLGEQLLDELAYRLLEAVRVTGAKRVVIDGLGGLMVTPTFPERDGSFLSSLANELRRSGATTLITLEETEIGHISPEVTTRTLSALSDNVVYLRVPRGPVARRLVSIGKVRNTRHDPLTREIMLGERGLHIGEAMTPRPPGNGDATRD